MRQWRTIRNSNAWPYKLEVHISYSMTDITTIPTPNLSFLASASSRKVSTSDYNIERQPEIAIQPPKPETVTLLCWITLHPYVQQLWGSNLYKHCRRLKWRHLTWFRNVLRIFTNHNLALILIIFDKRLHFKVLIMFICLNSPIQCSFNVLKSHFYLYFGSFYPSYKKVKEENSQFSGSRGGKGGPYFGCEFWVKLQEDFLGLLICYSIRYHLTILQKTAL